MKIGLINVYSTRNLGDSAIYSALAKLSPDGQVLAQLQETNPVPTSGLKIVDSLSNCDAYISVGGDIFNNARQWFITKQFLKNLQMLRYESDKTIVFNQSIPSSCHGFSFKLLAWHFKRLAAVVVRDEESYKRLHHANVAVRLSYDTAFALSSNQVAEEAARQALNSLDIDPEKAAIISVRSFDNMYRHNNNEFVKNIIKLCSQLEKRGHQTVLVIQSDAMGADNDNQIIRLISQAVPAVKVLNLIQNSGKLAAWEFLIGLLAICRLVIGVRYHTSVLRLAANRMPFNFY